ncbi:MAG TPA: helix-turn-helix domain-containing protein [Clostridiaceae bacterium]|nr:helix-turn-helix domain-containing protein [Clostridiaceae bacterium]
MRAKLDITQEQLANIIGVSRQTINAIESGRREMDWMMLVITVLFFLRMSIYTPELAEYLEIDSDDSKG